VKVSLDLDQEFIDAFYTLADKQDSPELAIAALLADLAWQRERSERDLRCRWNTLTYRQQEIALFILEGKTYLEIARILGVGLETVRTHARALYARMGARRKKDLRAMMVKMEVLHGHLEAYKTRTWEKIQKVAKRG
jgi:DNA-binding CsgD family transcriptional regulator